MGSIGRPSTCVVIGGGFAGLVTARVLSAHFDQVTVIERDQFPDGPTARKGVPQSAQSHVLLRRGVVGLAALFPGFVEELIAQGAVLSSASEDWWSLFQKGLLPRFESDLSFPSASRALIDFVLLSRLRRINNIELKDQIQLASIQLSLKKSPVIELQNSDGTREIVMPAACVDASGSASQAEVWLANSGFGKPAQWTTNPGVGYCTYRIRKPKLPQGCHAVLVQHKAPTWSGGGNILPIENNAYLVTLTGYQGNHPPKDIPAFLGFARALRTTVLYEAIKDARFISRPKTFRKARNIFKRFSSLRQWPQGFLVIGDALANFNPVYGQGMTSAVLAAEAIASQAKLLSNPARYKRLQSRVSRRLLGPWVMAMLEDMRWIETKGLRRWLLHGAFAYVDRVMQISANDPRTCYRFLAVLHLEKSPLSLAAPAVVLKVLSSFFPTSYKKANSGQEKSTVSRDKAS